MAIIGSASIQIRADDKFFEADVQRAVRRIKNVAIELKADVDLTKASKKIRDLRYRITSKDAVLTVDANIVKAEEKLAKLLAKFTGKDLEFTATANTAGANTKLTTLRDRFKNSRIPFTANADTAAANAQLAYAARNRTSKINVNVDKDVMRGLTGLMNTITGTIPAEKIKGALVGVASGFEGLALKATVATAAVFSLSGALLTTAANAFSIAGDLTQVIGVAGLFPAAVFGIVTAVKATTMAWQGFGDAMKEAKTPAQIKAQQEALAKLPPEAQKAVKALQEIRGEVQKPVQKAYWEAMGTSLQDMIDKKFPEFKSGMTQVGGAMGRYTAAALDAVGNTADFNDIFVNVTDTIDNLAKGLEPAIDALQRWIGTGSTYLPQFGNWVSDLSTKFAAWTKEAQETGKMNEWIDTGIQRIQELGSIVKSTTGIFSGLTTAARASGAPGLTEMAESLRHIRDIVNGEPFQSHLITILEGARAGVDKLKEGFGQLTAFIGDSSTTIGLFLEESGKIAGTAFKSIKTLFDGTGLGTGMFISLEGLNTLLHDLQPGIHDLGVSLGILGTIAGEVIMAFGPGLTQLFGTIRGVLEEVQKGVTDSIPIFNRFVEALMGALQGPIIQIASILGDLLEGFANLPGPIQGVIMSLGLFLMFKNKFLGFFDTLGASAEGNGKRTETALSKMRTGVRDMAFDAKHYVGGMGSDWGLFRDKATDAMEKTRYGVQANMGQLANYVPTTIRNMGAGIASIPATFGAAFQQVGRDFVREFDTVRAGLSRIPENARDAASRFSAAWSTGVSNIGERIAPAGSSLRTFADNVRATSSTMGENLAPARTAFSQLAQHTQSVVSGMGSSIASGLKSVGGSLAGFLGGPWGIAIMAATALFAEFAQQQQKHKQQVDTLAAAYEQSGGRIDAAVRKVIAANLDMKDSFFGLQFDSAYDIAKKVGVPLKDVTDAAAGVPGAMKKVQDSLAQSGNAASKFGQTFNGVLEVMKNTGGPLRGIADLIDKSGLFKTEGDKLTEQISKQNQVQEEAKRVNEELAQKLGVGSAAAQKMTSNYEVLRDAASSVSDRVEALKSNIDLQNGSMMSSQNAARDHAKAMFDLDDAMKGLAGSGKEIIDANGRMNDSFRDTLVTTDGLFQNNSRQAIKFSEEMDAAATSIITLGMNEMKKLQDTGASLPEAQAGAMKVMNEQTETLRAKLSTLGFDAGTVNAILGQLGLNPDKLQAALVVDTKDAEADLMRFEIMKAAIVQGNWEVALTATSDSVKEEILKTKEYKDAFEKDGWKGVISLIDKSGPGIADFMLKIAGAKDKSEVNAILDAEFKGRTKLKEATDGITSFDGLDAKADLGIEGHDLDIPDSVKTKLAEVDGQTANATVTATDAATPAVEGAKGSIGGWNFLEAAQKDLLARNMTGPYVLDAQGTMNSLYSVERALTAQNAAEPGRASTQATLESLRGVIRNLEGNNNAGPGLSAAQGTIDSLRGKTATLSAEDQASAIVDSVNRKGIANKSFSISALWDGVSEGVKRILGFAQGGIINGAGVQSFANGGVNLPNVKSFASGSEKHVAQIARGAWPVRIWAEPETGGEAYIPLSKSKRKRSLEILRQVMDQFGLANLAQFADGGTMRGMNIAPRNNTFNGFKGNTSTMVTASAAGVAPTIVTNVYPSQGLNEEQVADSVSENIFWRLANKI